MRKTRAGRILLGITNLVILAIMFTAVYSAIPPAYNMVISSATIDTTPTVRIVSINYTVTNNGFYEIDNFYVGLRANDPFGAYVNSSSSSPASVPRGSSQNGTISLSITLSYISAHSGNYAITLTINSEFAYGLIKFTVESPQVVPLS